MHGLPVLKTAYNTCIFSCSIFGRRYVRVGVLNGQIYAVGGYDGSAHLNTVERFNPLTNTWGPVANMASRRSSAGVAVMNDFLYVVGKLNLLISLNTCTTLNRKPKLKRLSNTPYIFRS